MMKIVYIQICQIQKVKLFQIIQMRKKKRKKNLSKVVLGKMKVKAKHYLIIQIVKKKKLNKIKMKVKVKHYLIIQKVKKKK